MWGNTGRSEQSGNCNQEVLNERRIYFKLKRENFQRACKKVQNDF